MSNRGYFSQFFVDVGDGSAFETVLRGHLWVEGELLRSLEAALPFPGRVDLDRIPFTQKVALVAAHGLMRDDEQAGFRRLNTLRNRMAHRLDAALTEQDEADLCNALGGRHRGHLAALRESEFPQEFPHGIKYALTAMCIQLQVDREKMQQANARLRASAQRLLDVARERGAE